MSLFAANPNTLLRMRTSPAARHHRTHRNHVTIFLATLLTACASSSSGSAGTVDKVLDLVGLQVKQPPQIATDLAVERLPRTKLVTLRVHAGDALNTDSSGHALSLVLRIYRINDVDAFARLPYDAFLGANPAHVDGALSVREVVLTPGQRYEVIESMPPDTTHLGIVALFRAPDENRWRFIFDVPSAASTGVTLGAHACALSVAEGRPLGAAIETMRLAGVRCR